MRATLKIRNVSGQAYTVEETGTVLEDREVLDLLTIYDNWDAAHTLVSTIATAKLYQDIQTGKIRVVESIAPSTPPLESGDRG